jgi:hypothetical protein
LGRPLHNLHHDGTLTRESSAPRYEFTVGYDNTGLWCGTAFFFLISASFFFAMSGLTLVHAGIVPGRLPPGFGPGNYAFGATVCTVFGLAGWYCGVVAMRRSQCFEVWTTGIRWIRRKKLCGQLSWEDITRLVLRDDNGDRLGHRRYSWNSIRYVDVQLKRHRQHALRGGDVHCVPELHIHLKSGGELVLHQLDDVWRFRELIQAGPDALLS